jgi:type I restriction enzyme S subunit
MSEMSVDELENLTHLLAFPRDWQILPIESLCLKVTSGGTPSRKNPEFYKDGNIIWIKTQELKDWYIENSQEKITEEALKKSSAKLLPVNTVLMAMYGDGRTITSLGILRKEAATNQACCALVPNFDICEPLYLFYLLKFHKNHLIKLALGGVQRNLSGTIIRNFKVKVPPLPIQRKIAAILSAYDDLIENNTRRIEILEEMARSLYREWFVNFRFPGHEQVKMVDSELGLIPEGWRYSSLKELPIQFIDGDRSSNYPKRSEFVDNGIIFLSTKNINQDKIDLSKVNFITREKFESIKKGRVQPLDIVMTTRKSIGKVALFNCKYSTALINAQMLILRADGKVIDQIYLFYLMCSNEYQEVIKNFASGSTQPQIPIQDLKQIEILCPPIAIQRKFSEIVSSYNSLIKNLQSKNANLRQTRDLLLPKLISGEIDVEKLYINTGDIAA